MQAKGHRGWRQNVAAVAFIGGLIVAANLALLPWWLPGLYLLLSFVTFAVYDIDKKASIQGQWRTPEFRLQLFALMGGWPGALLAQNLLRHKSNKNSFLRFFWLMTLLNLGAFFWFVFADSASALRQLLGM